MVMVIRRARCVMTDVQVAARAVIDRARQREYLLSGDIRVEAARAGLAEDSWRDVVVAARPALRMVRGRYYYTAPAAQGLRGRVRQEARDLARMRRTVREFLRNGRRQGEAEQRQCGRLPFVCPVRVVTAAGEELNFISQDVSLSGIRLIGNRSLAAQRVTVEVPKARGGAWRFGVAVLWAKTIGDGLVQQGGVFVGAAGKKS